MPKQQRKFYLKKRDDRKGIYYVRFSHTPSAWRSSGETDPAAAIEWACLHAEPCAIRDKNSITLRQFAQGFFCEDSQGWVARKLARGRQYSRKYLVCNDGYLANHILPHFGARTLQSLSVRELDNCLMAIPKSPATKNKVLNALRIVLQEAVEQEIIKENVTTQIKPFIEQAAPKKTFTATELTKLFPRDRTELLAIWKHISWAVYFRVLAVTGLRPGEVAGLQWRDFHPDLGGLSVTRAVETGTGRLKGLKTEKSGKAFKPALLDDESIAQLKELKSRSAHASALELIFTVPATGNVINANTSKKIFAGAQKRAGLDAERTPYCLRHTFQTQQLKYLSREAVADLMGHVSYRADYDHRTATDLLAQYQKLRGHIGIPM